MKNALSTLMESPIRKMLFKPLGMLGLAVSLIIASALGAPAQASAVSAAPTACKNSFIRDSIITGTETQSSDLQRSSERDVPAEPFAKDKSANKLHAESELPWYFKLYIKKSEIQNDQAFNKLLAGDLKSWSEFIDQISTYGMGVKVIQILQASIKNFPKETKVQINQKIFQVYSSKVAKERPLELMHYDFSIGRTALIKSDIKESINQDWAQPKRIFDRIFLSTLDGLSAFRKEIKQGQDQWQAYDKYLATVRSESQAKYAEYTAQDVRLAAEAMQLKLREIIQDPRFVEEERSWLFFKKKAKPYLVIYGSFPNGRADFRKGSDIDLAVSYAKLSDGANDRLTDFSDDTYLSTWDLERAAIKVLSERLSIGEEMYKPEQHRFITKDKLFNSYLSELSPIKIVITPELIEFKID
jgi:predicted nucleotidyltransferase